MQRWGFLLPGRYSYAKDGIAFWLAIPSFAVRYFGLPQKLPNVLDAALAVDAHCLRGLEGDELTHVLQQAVRRRRVPDKMLFAPALLAEPRQA